MIDRLPKLSAQATEWDRTLYRALFDAFRGQETRLRALEKVLGIPPGKPGHMSWDEANAILKLDGPGNVAYVSGADPRAGYLEVDGSGPADGGGAFVIGGDAIADGEGGGAEVDGGAGHGGGTGGQARVTGGTGGITGDGGGVIIASGDAGSTSGDGGDVSILVGAGHGGGRNGRILLAAYVILNTQQAVAALPPAADYPLGITYVTDAFAPIFGAVVAGGGAIFAPVYSDGTDWRCG